MLEIKFDETFSYSLSELSVLILKVYPMLVQHKIIVLHGQLGAGKTTFTAALCNFLNTKEKADSPTFSLINNYTFTDKQGHEQTIFHSDWYRIKDEEEARSAGIEDMLDSNYFLCLIEWSENAPDLIPEDALHLIFKLGEKTNERLLKLQNHFNY